MSGTEGGLPPFQEFLEANRATVYRFLVVAVGPQEADDAFQETFIAALHAYPKVQEPAKLDRWILAIASRKAIDQHRRASRHPVPTAEVPESPSRGNPEPSDPADPLWAAVRELPPRQRVAVVHRYVLDTSYGEIAALMGSSEQTVRANVYQGMKRLKELMR
ncbi:MAG: RNA polymerase sigma factor [Actinomycetota bacterium]